MSARNLNLVLAIANSALVLVALVTAGVAIYSMRNERARARASLVSDLYRDLLANSPKQQMLYRIEYGEFDYDSQAFHGSEDERALDELLVFLDLVCNLSLNGAVTARERAVFDYHILTVRRDVGVRAYLTFLEGWVERRGLPPAKYRSFKEVGDELVRDYGD